MIKNGMKVLTVSALALCASTQAQAAGYQLNDYSMTGLGRAYAGAGIVGDDFSAMAFNPAGMVLNETSGVQAGVTMVQQHGNVRGTVRRGAGLVNGYKNVDVWSTLPQFFGQYKVNDRMTVGMGIYAPFGLATKYGREWFGSDQGITSSLKVVDFAPAVAYRVTDSLSLGATVIARYVKGDMTNTLGSVGYSRFNLDGWQAYATFGAMYEYDENTRFGLAYRMENDHTVKGTFGVSGTNGMSPPLPPSGTFDGNSTTPLPQHILLSAFHKHGKFGFSGSARWTKWDSFKTFTMSAPGLGLNASSKYNWRNTWTISAGLDYYYDEQLTLRMGTAYDQSPAKGPQNRTARIPDSNRYWASFGLSYAFTKQLTIDAAYTHLFLNKYKVTQIDALGIKEDLTYDVGANVFGLQVQYKF